MQIITPRKVCHAGCYKNSIRLTRLDAPFCMKNHTKRVQIRIFCGTLYEKSYKMPKFSFEYADFV